MTADLFLYLSSALVISAAMHVYLYRRMLPRTRATRMPLYAGTLLLPAGMVALLCMNLFSRAWLAPVLITAFFWVGCLYFTAMFCVVAELSGKRGVWPLALGFLVGVGSVVQAQRPPIVVAHEVHLQGWMHDGYRIVHLSDLHVGAVIRKKDVEDIVQKSNALSPDLVAITGDLVDGNPEDLLPDLEPLRALKAKDGVFFVLGNHEYISRAERWAPAIRSLGLRVLDNEVVPLDGFSLAGLDDAAPNVALRADVALVHQPRVATHAKLQLSGHTHGSQLAPLGFLEAWDQGCVHGLCTVGETIVHVTAGTGYWGPPMRFFSRNEVALLTLRPKS